jgi:hypothetical protein
MRRSRAGEGHGRTAWTVRRAGRGRWLPCSAIRFRGCRGGSVEYLLGDVAARVGTHTPVTLAGIQRWPVKLPVMPVDGGTVAVAAFVKSRLDGACVRMTDVVKKGMGLPPGDPGVVEFAGRTSDSPRCTSTCASL